MRDQLSKYRAAIGRRSTKSDPGAAQMADVRNTAIGANRAITTRSRRASWEGYSQGSSTHLGMTGTGYLAEANQVARNRHKAASSIPVPSRSVTSNPVAHVGFMNRNFVDHSMMGSAKSSIRKMRSLLQLDKVI